MDMRNGDFSVQQITEKLNLLLQNVAPCTNQIYICVEEEQWLVISDVIFLKKSVIKCISK